MGNCSGGLQWGTVVGDCHRRLQSPVLGTEDWVGTGCWVAGGLGTGWGTGFWRLKNVGCLRVGQRLQLSWPENVGSLRVASPPDPQSPSNPQLSAHTLKLPLPSSHKCKSPQSLTGISGALWHDNV